MGPKRCRWSFSILFERTVGRCRNKGERKTAEDFVEICGSEISAYLILEKSEEVRIDLTEMKSRVQLSCFRRNGKREKERKERERERERIIFLRKNEKKLDVG